MKTGSIALLSWIENNGNNAFYGKIGGACDGDAGRPKAKPPRFGRGGFRLRRAAPQTRIAAISGGYSCIGCFVKKLS
jgi:hypothetical protein